MKTNNMLTVFKKEAKDISRDRRTLITSILIPMILIPVLNLLVGGGVSKLQNDISSNITITLSQESNDEFSKDLLKNEILASWDNVIYVETEDPITAIRDEKARVVLEFEQGYREKFERNEQFGITIFYDRSKAKSEGSLGIIQSMLSEFQRKTVEKRLLALNIDTQILEPFSLNMEDVADNTATTNPMMMMMIPMMITILVAVGGIPAATDLVAGEKERNTFEPLLTTKPGRVSILLGKYFAVTLFSLVSVAAILAGFAIAIGLNPEFMSMGSGQEISGFNIPVPAIILSVAITLLLGMTFAGIQLTISTYARSFKEAQTYLSFLIFAAMIPGYATMFMQPSDIQLYMFFIPILNTISAFKMVLGGVTNYTALIVAFVSSLIYVGGTLAVAVWFFNREEALFRC